MACLGIASESRLYSQAREPEVTEAADTTLDSTGLDLSALAENARSIVLFRRDCRTAWGSRDFTLFANGTLRYRLRRDEAVSMWLAELARDEVSAFAARLAEPTLRETDSHYRTLVGDLVETCTLQLALPGRPLQQFEFDAHTPLSLDLDHVLKVVAELEGRIDLSTPPEGSERLPIDYQPRAGDVLVRAGDGALFRVMGRTQDGQHWELQGLEQPVSLFEGGTDLSRRFSALLERRRQRR